MNTLSPLVLSIFLAKYVTGQFSLLILLATFWMEAPWLPTALNMFEDITPQHPIVLNLIPHLEKNQLS